MTTAPTLDAEATDADAIFRRVVERLPSELASGALDRTVTPEHGDHSLNAWSVSESFLGTTRTAAVLVGLVARADGVTVLLTLRTDGLRDHAGQIAFPGGKIEESDAGPAAAALREAHEEIGLPPACVDVLGYLGPYLTRTGFRIIPVVARIDPPFDLVVNRDEVADAFEVPFAMLMEEASYRLMYREWQGSQRAFYSIAHGERTIWGVTAGILRILYERLYR